jgi:hypothetical protein
MASLYTDTEGREYQLECNPATLAAVKLDVQAQMYPCLMNSSDRISYILNRESMLGFDETSVAAARELLDTWKQERSVIDAWRRLLDEPIPIVRATMLETSEQGQFIRKAHPQWPMTYTQERRLELLETYFAETRALRDDPTTPDVPEVRLSRLLLPDSIAKNDRYFRPERYPDGPFDFVRLLDDPA